MKNGYWHKVISEWFKDSEKYKLQVKYSGFVQGQPFSSMLHKVYVDDSLMTVLNVKNRFKMLATDFQYFETNISKITPTS